MIDFSCKKFELSEIIKCAFGLTKSEVSLFFLLKEKRAQTLASGQLCTAESLATELSLDMTTVQKGLKKLFDAEVLTRMQENRPIGGYVYLYSMKPKKEIADMIMTRVSLWVTKVDDELMR